MGKRGQSNENERSAESVPTVSGIHTVREGLEIGADFGPRYTILEKLGEGGMGAVYLAKDKELNREVALKLIRPAISGETLAMERFKREIVLAGKITHKNILRIHDLGEVDGLRYVSMNYVRGRDLRKILKEESPLPVDRVVEILKQLCLGLKAAHEEAVVHRDLKPPNILMDDQDHVYITDFGLARSMEISEETSLTGTGQVPGTPLYMSPEQIKGEEIGKQSDLYTLGIVLYEMLTGKFPFDRSGSFQTLVQRLRNRPKNPKHANAAVPDYLASIAMKCMEPDPANRYKDASEILESLETQKVHSVFLRSNRARIRKIGTFSVAAVLIAALTAGILYKSSLKHSALQVQSLAILPIENATSDPGLQWMSRAFHDLLSMQLREHKSIRLVSGVHLTRILNSEPHSLQADSLKNIAASCNANFILKGKLLKGSSGVRLAADLYGFDDDFEKAVQFNSEGKFETVFHQIVSNLQEHLGIADLDPNMWVIPSLEGAQTYYESLDFFDKGNLERGTQLLTNLKSSGPFQALAQLKLAIILYKTDQIADAKKHLELANQLSQTVAPYDRFKIQIRQAEVSEKLDSVPAIYKELLAAYPNDSDLYAEIADHYSSREEWEQALENYNRARVLDPKDIRILIAIGRTQMKKGNPQTALTFLVEASSLQKLLNDKERADLLNILGVAYRQIEYHESALEHFQKSMAIKKKIGDQKGVATTLGNIGNVFRDMGRYKDARASYEEALTLSEQLGDQGVAARMLNNIGYLCEKAGFLDDALASYKRALDFARATKLPVEIANRLNNIGWIYYLQGRYGDADTYFDLGLKEIGESDPTTRASLQLSRGNLLMDRGEYSKAIDAYQDSIQLLKKTENQALQAFALTDQARCYSFLGNFTEGKRYLDQAQSIADEKNDKELSAYLLLGRAEWHRLQDDSASAEPLIRQARLLAEQSKNEIALRLIKLELGTISVAKGKTSEAIVLLDEVARQADLSGMRPLIPRTRLELARAYMLQSKNAEALTQLKSALELSKELGLQEVQFRAHSLAAVVNQKNGSPKVALSHIQQALKILAILQKQSGSYANLFLAQKQIQLFLRQASASYNEADKQNDFSQYAKWITEK
ncbi:tetratricopeptide repeat protein [bacterium]|nr:tetratricopeptide repeat protein [bacterium]